MTRSSQPAAKCLLEELIENLATDQPIVLRATVTVRPTNNGFPTQQPFSQYTGMVKIHSHSLTQCVIKSSFDNGATYHFQFVPKPVYRDEQRTHTGYATIEGRPFGTHCPEQYTFCVEIKPLAAIPSKK